MRHLKHCPVPLRTPRRRALTRVPARFVLPRPRQWQNRLSASGAAFLLVMAGALFAVTPAHAVSAISVSSTTVAAGNTFTVNFTGTSDSDRTDVGFNFYAGAHSTSLGTLDRFTTIEPCTGNTSPCVNQPALGPRVPLRDLNADDPFGGSITLRINPGTPAGTFLLRYQLYSTTSGGEATQVGPTTTVTVPPSADLGKVDVTATRTASTPVDPNPANDSASATCTVISVILTTCP